MIFESGVGKERVFDLVPVSKIPQDFFRVIADGRELDSLSFKPWNRILQLDQLPFAERSPVSRTEKQQNGRTLTQMEMRESALPTAWEPLTKRCRISNTCKLVGAFLEVRSCSSSSAAVCSFSYWGYRPTSKQISAGFTSFKLGCISRPSRSHCATTDWGISSASRRMDFGTTSIFLTRLFSE